VRQENVSTSSIYRHFKKHFNTELNSKIAVIEVRDKVQQARSLYREGFQVAFDKVNTLHHLVEVSMLNIEELERSHDRSKDRHELTIKYMSGIRGMIETIAKLTGDLKQEGTVDINFFNNEIHIFADIVLEAIREVDGVLELNGALEQVFFTQFKQRWQDYVERQRKMVDGELSLKEASRDHNVNHFNES
jgi:hypothetical protein